MKKNVIAIKHCFIKENIRRFIKEREGVSIFFTIMGIVYLCLALIAFVNLLIDKKQWSDDAKMGIILLVIMGVVTIAIAVNDKKS